jgi:DNA-binding NarL/FixJ family response regulator
MQLILAIDSDPRRSEQLANLVRSRLEVDLVQATSAGEGLHALRDRVPDLILTSPLLSPFDDGVLDEYLRDLGAAATHVQTVRIPMLSTGPRKSAAKRLFSLGRKTQTSAAAPDGCDPKVFADEIAHYLTRSLDGRSVVAKAAPPNVRESEPAPAMQRVDAAFARGASAPEDWGAPEVLVQEFREAVTATPVEDTHVPGSILDLRTPIVHAPEPVKFAQGRPVAVEPEAMTYVFAEPEPVAFVAPEPVAFVAPEPVVIEPEPLFVEPEFVEPERPAYVRPELLYVEPAPVAHVDRTPPVITQPERPVDSVQGRPAPVKPAGIKAPVSTTPATTNAAAPSTGNSASFEAALAAIRAAWATPEPKTPAPAVPVSAASRAKPMAGSGEVDLTNEIDAMEDVTGVEGSTPATDDHSPDDQTPSARRKPDASSKRPEKPRVRKTRGAGERDDWSGLDQNQYEFSALVKKLDEVTEDKVTPRATNRR